MQCTDKLILVTGAQQGIGRAMALEFAAAGADVAINWLDDEAAAEGVADEVRGRGRRALLVKADVARIEQVQPMVAAVEQGLGPIDVLINNAGVFPRVPFLEMTESDWDHVLGVNLKGSCAGGGESDGFSGPAGGDHQFDLGRGVPQFSTRRALRR